MGGGGGYSWTSRVLVLPVVGTAGCEMVPKVIATPRSGDVRSESASFNLGSKQGLCGFTWKLQTRYTGHTQAM